MNFIPNRELMKLIIKPMFLCFFLTLSLLACNNEELFVEPTTEVVPTTPEESTGNTDTDPVAPNVSTPCDFKLDAVQANATVVINCVMDLQGKTVNLPAGVTLVYEGGDIINGTLNFANNTTISGELMNSTLTMAGTKPQLKDPEFYLNPERWGIIQGKVSNEVAASNRIIFKSLINQIKGLGIKTLKLDVFDVYFKVDNPPSNLTPTEFGITIPSDFNLFMTDNTHLRMQPNGYIQPRLLSVLDASNVIIQGGTFHGDRDEHDYSDGSTHEWGHLISLKACNNVIVRNATFMDASGDGIDVSGLNHAWMPNYKPSYDVLITNNKFLRNRRNNLSITSAHHIIVENNEFIDAGIHTAKSKGIAPSFAIDIEADRTSNTIWEIAEDIIVRNNIERGSRVGGFTIHTGDRVIIEGNQMEKSISYSTSIGSIIRNNTLIATTDEAKNYDIAITAGRNDRYERNYGNRVYGNTIIGYSTGMTISNTDLEVYDNNITDCKRGIVVEMIKNSKIYNNTIKSKRSIDAGCDGIVNSAGYSKYIDEVQFTNNKIDVLRTPLLFVDINNDIGEENFKFTFENNLITSTNTSTMSNINGFNFNNNTITQGGIRIVNSKNSEIKSNTITSAVSHGIELTSGNSNIKILNNKITIIGNNQCVKTNSTDKLIDISSTICN